MPGEIAIEENGLSKKKYCQMKGRLILNLLLQWKFVKSDYSKRQL